MSLCFAVVSMSPHAGQYPCQIFQTRFFKELRRCQVAGFRPPVAGFRPPAGGLGRRIQLKPLRPPVVSAAALSSQGLPHSTETSSQGSRRSPNPHSKQALDMTPASHARAPAPWRHPRHDFSPRTRTLPRSSSPPPAISFDLGPNLLAPAPRRPLCLLFIPAPRPRPAVARLEPSRQNPPLGDASEPVTPARKVPHAATVVRAHSTID